jgi:hypothetical protein
MLLLRFLGRKPLEARETFRAPSGTDLLYAIAPMQGTRFITFGTQRRTDRFLKRMASRQTRGGSDRRLYSRNFISDNRLQNSSTLSEVTRRSTPDGTVETGSPRQFG